MFLRELSVVSLAIEVEVEELNRDDRSRFEMSLLLLAAFDSSHRDQWTLANLIDQVTIVIQRNSRTYLKEKKRFFVFILFLNIKSAPQDLILRKRKEKEKKKGKKLINFCVYVF